MQTPNVGALMNEATKQGIIDGTHDLTYFVRSEDIVLTKNKTMAHWRERFYALLSRNSQDATSMWNVPDDQTVGLRISTKL
jgi:KUP system potassium uptake protein